MKSLKENFQKLNILIIGSGIIGKFNALELIEQGHKVTITDPWEVKNSSSAALGVLMGNIYRKRKGRSWLLRKKSLDLWPQWIKLLNNYDPLLKIEKPLIQLTNKKDNFEKQQKFFLDHPNESLKVLENDSFIIDKVNKIFNIKNLRGIISYEDGRIDPNLLLKTLDIYLKKNNAKIIKDKIIKISKVKNEWLCISRNNIEIKSDIVILCNSLNALDFINYKDLDIKLKPVLGQAMEITINEKEINFLSLPKHFSINGKNIIPKSKNKIIIGSTDEYSMEPKKGFFDELTEAFEQKPKWLNKKNISQNWFGIRSQPVGEPSPIMRSIEKGLIICTGFYKNGILLAPACSKWVSNEIEKII